MVLSVKRLGNQGPRGIICESKAKQIEACETRVVQKVELDQMSSK